ncbi:MAG: hypothetical protein DMG89_20955 [Acidobacteria bacterium]|nr:MAG: hypothetical protein DMG89_20955 [Acidobacteriota bacterium]
MRSGKSTTPEPADTKWTHFEPGRCELLDLGSQTERERSVFGRVGDIAQLMWIILQIIEPDATFLVHD